MAEPPDDAATRPARILDMAERLVQRRGFNGFSYADVAAARDHDGQPALPLPRQGRAGRALIERYAARSSARGASTPGGADAPAKLAAYARLYADVLRERMCLCGMLAAEYETLPEAMRDAVLALLRRERGLARRRPRGRAATGDARVRRRGRARRRAC